MYQTVLSRDWGYSSTHGQLLLNSAQKPVKCAHNTNNNGLVSANIALNNPPLECPTIFISERYTMSM